MPDVHCRRCEQTRPALDHPPMPGRYGEAIMAHACAACWQEWVSEQTIIMNHYGLRPHVPHDRERLYRLMCDFLKLPIPPPSL